MAECEIITLSVTKEQKEAIEKLFEDNKWELTYQTIECVIYSLSNSSICDKNFKLMIYSIFSSFI